MSTRTPLVSPVGILCLLGALTACDTRVDLPPEKAASTANVVESPASTVSASSSASAGSASGGAGGSATQTQGGTSSAGQASAGAANASKGGSGGTAGTAAASGGTAGNSAGGSGGSGSGSGGGGGASVSVPNDGVLRILPLGDSITLGPQGGYRNDLYQLLTADGIEVDMVGTQYDTWTEIADKDHEGHPGFTIGNVRQNVDGYLDAISTPNLVLLMLGTNDLAWWTAQTASTTKDTLIELTDHVLERLPQAVLVVATIPPESSANIEPNDVDRAVLTQQYNSLVKAALASHPQNGSRVFTADVNAVLSLSDLYDGIHPTREAHRKIAGVFYDVIKNNLSF